MLRVACLLLVSGCILPETTHKPNCGSEYCGATEVCDHTDPSTGVVLQCASGSGSGGSDECHDIDTDGDGEPHDVDHSDQVGTDSDDDDGDGIPNDQDFCEHAPGGATDEDGDGIGDVCDPCPIAPPPAVPDPDGDAVDSPCDPDPRTGGDQILFFDGFNNGLDPNWKATTASAWTIEGGELVVTLAGAPNADFLQMGVIAKNNMSVEAAYRVDRVETGSSDHFVIVGGSDPRPAGVATMQCGLDHNDTTASDQVSLSTNLSGAMAPAQKAFDTASLYEIGAYAHTGSVGCTALGDGAALGVVQAQISPDSLSSVALGARAVTARYEWVLVVGRD